MFFQLRTAQKDAHRKNSKQIEEHKLGKYFGKNNAPGPKDSMMQESALLVTSVPREFVNKP